VFYPAKIPFPLVHIDTGHNFQETIDYRDALAERLGAELIVGSVQESIDTGRLFPETYQLIDKTNLTYNIKLEVFFPDYREVQRMIREEGINLFYNSIESRHRCCQIRKLEPLAALSKVLMSGYAVCAENRV
jgi:3'-phosphoadenosine 5'-phosphosulfate sulfotransferase (PAPS reductase)/FAD synthetase